MDDFAGFSPQDVLRLQVFVPDLYDRVKRALATGQRFVHYTSAPAAMSLIRNREMWLRNTQCMNDFSEVEHGIRLLDRADRGPLGRKLLGFLDGIFSGFGEELKDALDDFADTVKFDTYIGCYSEHESAEDDTGRLSMWRSYSGICGIAFVLNRNPLLSPGSDALNVNSGPIFYARREVFIERFQAFVEGLLRHGAYIEEIGAAKTRRNLLYSYYFSAVSTKHPGFAEEREWRLVHNPRLDPSSYLIRSVEICRNEPQIVYKLPLRNQPEIGIDGLDLRECLEAVIIGPCENPRSVRAAFIDLLCDAGVTNAEDIIRISDIPIR